MLDVISPVLFPVLLTCAEAHMIVNRALLDPKVPFFVAEEIVTEIRLISPKDCSLPTLNR